jgi:hypothetical protein
MSYLKRVAAQRERNRLIEQTRKRLEREARDATVRVPVKPEVFKMGKTPSGRIVCTNCYEELIYERPGGWQSHNSSNCSGPKPHRLSQTGI